MGVFTVIHALFTKKKSKKEIVFILVSKWAVNITTFINDDLLFFKKEGTLEEEMVRKFDILSTHINFIKTIPEIMFRFVTS